MLHHLHGEVGLALILRGLAGSVWNGVVMRTVEGSPISEQYMASSTLHDVQAPQSPMALTIRWRGRADRRVFMVMCARVGLAQDEVRVDEAALLQQLRHADSRSRAARLAVSMRPSTAWRAACSRRGAGVRGGDLGSGATGSTYSRVMAFSLCGGLQN